MIVKGYQIPDYICLNTTRDSIERCVEAAGRIGLVKWYTADGRQLHLEDMTDSHVNNCITYHLDNIEKGMYADWHAVAAAFNCAMLMLTYRQYRIHQGLWTLGTKLKAKHHEHLELENANKAISY